MAQNLCMDNEEDGSSGGLETIVVCTSWLSISEEDDPGT